MAKRKTHKRKTVKRRRTHSTLKVVLAGKGLRLPHGYKVVKCKTCKHRRKKK